MALRIHDPGHVALRRGLRAAVGFPVAIAISLYVIDDTQGALFAVFGTIGLLINSDFAGSWTRRLLSYLITGVVGTFALALGWAMSFNTPLAVITTFIVVFLLAYLLLLRGPVAVGVAAVQLLFIVAVSLENTPTSLGGYLEAWWVAVAVCTISALVLLPRNHLKDHRRALSTTLAAAADAVEEAGSTPPGESIGALAHFDESLRSLDDEFGGQPYRTSGLARRDQALILLVAMVNSARLLVVDAPGGPRLPDESSSRASLIQAIAKALRECSAAMLDQSRLPSARDLDTARVHFASTVYQWTAQAYADGQSPQEISQRISDEHAPRITALTVEQIVEVTRVANGGDVEDLDLLPPVPTVRPELLVRAQLSWQSPWLRNALRSALGLSLAVLIVNLIGIAHGFWVLIAVVAILRFDAVGTRRSAVQAVVGTLVGAVIATILIALVGGAAPLLWVLLPIAVFLAAWAPIALNFGIGQATFTMLILIAFAILNWPPDVLTGAIRVEDVMIGAGVAIVVGLLMWPRGAIGYLCTELATAIRTSAALLSSAITAYQPQTTSAELEALRTHAVETSQRAADTYDISVMQHGPAEDTRPWLSATVLAFLITITGRVVADLTSSNPEISTVPVFVDALNAAQQRSDRHWSAVAESLDSGQPTIAGVAEDEPLPTLPGLNGDDEARALIATIWATDWVRHLNRLSTSQTGDTVAAPGAARLA